MHAPCTSLMSEQDNSNSGSAPKKLKLTLKLNSSSSSSNSSSNLASSTTASPVKVAVVSGDAEPAKEPSAIADNITSTSASTATAAGLIDLPTGLGNVKGRGRPKKTANTPNMTSSEDSNANANPPATIANSEYSTDLKSFVSSMKTFQPRKWSLKRPVSLESRNVAGYEIVLANGLWCTMSTELGSANLKKESSAVTQPQQEETSTSSSSFEATCQCGKHFTDRSKYRKHVKIHEKAALKSEQEIVNIEDNSKPVISLKLKLKPQ